MRIFLSILSANEMKMFYGNYSINGDLLRHEPENVANKGELLFNKKVVISGTFNQWPDRRDLAMILKGMGADIDGGATKPRF